MATVNFSLSGTTTNQDGTVYHIGESGTDFARIDSMLDYYMGIDFVAYQLVLSATSGDKIQRKEFVKSA
ncbi:hypothetical protein D3C84_104070 [compost metagenome]